MESGIIIKENRFVMHIFVSIILFLSATYYSTTALTVESESYISVITYKASPKGFMSNSHILIGENEAVLIDAQFSIEEGKRVAELIKSTGKILSKIIITHPHPDHYYGLELLATEFDNAKITGGPKTITEVKNTAMYWANSEDNHQTLSVITLQNNKSIKLEDVEFNYRIFKGGESIENTIIYIPSSQTLFVGDLASNGIHMWVGENNINNWVEQLKEIRSMGPITTVYPGHGPVGSAGILDQAEEYLKSFSQSVNNSKNAEEAILKMKKLYPDYKMPQILEGSVRAIMWPGDKVQ